MARDEEAARQNIVPWPQQTGNGLVFGAFPETLIVTNVIEVAPCGTLYHNDGPVEVALNLIEYVEAWLSGELLLIAQLDWKTVDWKMGIKVPADHRCNGRAETIAALAEFGQKHGGYACFSSRYPAVSAELDPDLAAQFQRETENFWRRSELLSRTFQVS